MKICGFVKTSVFVIHTLVVFVMIGVANSTFTVIRSTKKNGQPDVDRFSNPSCKPLYCHRVFGSGSCAKPGCCYCQCNHSRLNYVMFSGRCVASDEIDEGEWQFYSEWLAGMLQHKTRERSYLKWWNKKKSNNSKQPFSSLVAYSEVLHRFNSFYFNGH